MRETLDSVTAMWLDNDMNNTYTDIIAIAIDLDDEFHAAGLLVPSDAVESFHAAAKAVNVDLLITSDAPTADAHRGDTDFEIRSARYDAMYKVLNLRRIEVSDVVADGVATLELDEFGELVDKEVTALLDRWGVAHSETDMVTVRIARAK